MPLITTKDLGKSYGPNDIFSSLNLSIPHTARIALVGANGVGKTTLLRLLLGLEEPSSGEVLRSRGLRAGYLPQEAQFISRHSLWDECLTAFAGLLEQQKEMARLEAAMSDPGQAEAALQAYGRLQEAFERQGGYTYETRIRQTLSGLGFAPEDFNRPLDQLSGGQRTRALLARLLLSDPDLLLLDEPTNHLDIAAVEWLETYLKEWGGAVLFVSHDRYFMDQVARTIWEMTPTIEVYHGNYSAYLIQRSERYQRRLEEYQAQAAFIEKEEEYIRRNIAGQNTRQAQGRRKRLERLLEEARLSPPTQSRRLHLRLEPAGRSGDLVLRTLGLSVGYADEGRPLFSVPDLTLVRGECAAVIGPNGAGKTTFLKTLLEQVPPYAGEVVLGAGLQIGYFSQAHEGLHPELDLIQEIQSVAPELRPGPAREYLAKFLFTGDDVFKPVSVLSGGERGRLALAKLARRGANLLLLDEPTNHLDLPAQEVLQAVLAGYHGTILLVSHDRYLIDALATQIWEVEPEQSALRIFEGTYSEYHSLKEAEASARSQPAESEAPAPGRSRARANPSVSNEERRRRSRLRELEERIAGLEAQMSALSRQLENPPDNPAKVQRLGSDYVRMQGELEQLLAEWEELQRTLE
ncbi:MAG: ABC-F family ATP-binding cassette domain-containing protein [Chloroflexi bacterium]|nr:ABC-F family ATP-binding cassette domain-containing protein [Chloroflexota bacterium]